MTPREVRRRYSNGRVLEVVFKNGYRKRGIWAIFFSAESVADAWAGMRGGKGYRSGRVVSSRDEMRRIGGARGHCKRG